MLTLDFSMTLIIKEKVTDYAILHFATHGILNSSSPVLSSLAMTEDNDSSMRIDFAQASPQYNPEISVEQEELADKIVAIIDKLSSREANIIKMRNGIGEYDMHTLEAVGREYDITRERVRQIEAKALIKIKKLLSFHLGDEENKVDYLVVPTKPGPSP